jgi:heme exporter protein A
MTLAANALACERNGRVIFSDLSFELRDGEAAMLRGPNGSGKTSLLRLIAGLLPAAAGTVVLTGNGGPMAQRTHFIGHQDAIKAVLTVAENLEFWAAILGDARASVDIGKALSAFALEALRHEPAAILSAGQRRRLALSRLFLVPRPLWLLDEPSTALDRQSLTVLRGHMDLHLAEGGLILMASHDDALGPVNATISLAGSGRSGP